jgi:hypothetical protein
MQLINMPKFGVLFTIKVSILYKQKNKNISVLYSGSSPYINYQVRSQFSSLPG